MKKAIIIFSAIFLTLAIGTSIIHGDDMRKFLISTSYGAVDAAAWFMSAWFLIKIIKYGGSWGDIVWLFTAVSFSVFWEMVLDMYGNGVSLRSFFHDPTHIEIISNMYLLRIFVLAVVGLGYTEGGGMLDQFKGWVGSKINGISLNIDIVNGCVLSCPSCAVGSMGRRPSHYMEIGLFERILDKAQRENKIRKVQLYMFSDPAMHKDLHLFVQACTDRDIPCLLSTVLQHTQCDWDKVIEARPAELRISFAGWDKMKYYQRGADRIRFWNNLTGLYPLDRYKETLCTMAYHLYNDNVGELKVAEAVAKSMHCKFVVIPAIFMPCEKVVEKHYTQQDFEIIQHLIETPEQNIARMKLKRYCTCWKQIAIDAYGDVQLCQLVYEDRFKLGFHFLTTPMWDILKAIKTHPFCHNCISNGGNVYQECFADFRIEGDPIALANKGRLK